jgi:exodeoxyribonuclease V gamma subunit
VVEVEELVKFVQHPVRAFLRQRLGLSVGDFNEEVEDNLRIELDGLGRWAVGTRLLDARLAGVDGRTANLAEIARGTLPPATLGKPVLDIVFPVVDAILAAAQSAVPDGTASGSLDVRLPLPDGRMLSGTVPGVSGDVVRTVTYSRVGPKHRLAAWVRLLVLTAAYPDRAFSAATVGKGGPTDAVIVRIPPLGDDAASREATATRHLTTLLDLHARGLREPLPLYVDTSAAYAEAVAAGRDPEGPARKRWESEWNFDHEDKDNEHQLVHGGIATYDEIIEAKPRPDESGDGWDERDETRLGRLATRLWDGLLGAEETTAL